MYHTVQTEATWQALVQLIRWLNCQWVNTAFTAGNGARAHGARAKAGAQSFCLSSLWPSQPRAYDGQPASSVPLTPFSNPQWW